MQALPSSIATRVDFRFQLFGEAGTTVANLLRQEDTTMLYYALIFLLVGLVAGALGLFGIAVVAAQISWILFLIGVVMLVVHLVSQSGRGARL